jgi:fimbrial chaperone protein
LRAFALAALLVLGSAASLRAEPAGVQITPITVEFAPARKVAALRVTNTSSETVAFDARVVAWSQQAGADVLSETSDVLVSPPAFMVAPGRTQVVRLGLTVAEDSKTERAYRLLLTQAPLEQGERPSGLAMRLQFSLPVFTAVGGGVQAPAIERAATGDLRIANRSARRIAIRKVEMMEGTRVVVLQAPRYLLAGQSAEIGAGNGAVTLAYTNADGEAAEVRLAARAP